MFVLELMLYLKANPLYFFLGSTSTCTDSTANTH